MRFDLFYGNGAVVVPEAALGYLDKAEPLALKLFLQLCGDRALRESLSVEALAKSHAVTPSDIEKALAFWQNAGLLVARGEDAAKESGNKEEKKNKKVTVSVKTADNGEKVTVVTGAMPTYTGKEIEAIMTGDPALSDLINECQRIVGKIFSIGEVNKLLAMVDYLRLDHASVLLLFTYAAGIDKRSVAYVEKIAAGLVNEGITAYEAIEAYISGKERLHSLENTVRRLAGIQGRVFSSKEKKFLALWGESGFSEELLTLAYEITVDNTGGFSFPYMNKVLLNWKEAGYETAAAVLEAGERYREAKKDGGGASFDVDEFFEAALKRSRDLMEPPKDSDDKK